MQVEGKLIIRSDGVRLLLSPYRQLLAEAKGAGKRVHAQVLALSKETRLDYGTIRTLRDGTPEVLLGTQIDCYPAGEIVAEALGAPERCFFAEEIGANRFVVIVIEDRKVGIDEIVTSEAELLSHFDAAIAQFGEAPYTLAVNQAIFDALPAVGTVNPQILEASMIETAPALSALKFRQVGQLGSRELTKKQKLSGAIAAGVLVLGFTGYMYKDRIDQESLAEEMAALAAIKNRALDPLATYKQTMAVTPADVFVSDIGDLIKLSSAATGWIPSRVQYENGAPLKISFNSFGGTRAQLVSEVRILDAGFSQAPEGIVMLVDVTRRPGRRGAPQLKPLPQVIIEALDAIEANSMGVLKVQVGELSSFGVWSSQKVQINVDGAPLPLITLLSIALKDRPANVTQVDLSLEHQSLSGVIHLDVFGS